MTQTINRPPDEKAHDPGMMHTVTAVDGSFDSGFLQDGEVWSFDEPGEYEYSSAPHYWMRAKVIVEP
jgi:plastocyanin